ncbi:ankyrin repeat-containing domain protein [Rhexocercosporidium sp. MPI-PUGE-AT-0058]|nr:ankyrin repeat-containing domain protein [Rhexocercosporidium sp. MPI-PUGE-AT-0058]
MADGAECRLKGLPLDVFKTLLDNVIDTIGIAGGARLRMVCKLFDREIPSALFRCPDFKLPTTDWSPSRPRVVEKFVLYRTLADGKRKSNLSARFHRILENLLPEEDPFGAEYQEALRSLVTSVVHQDFCDDNMIEFMDATRPSKLLDSTFRNDCLCAAAVLGVYQRFEEIIEYASRSNNQRYHSDRGAAIFHEGPLVCAAIGGQSLLIERILQARVAKGRETVHGDFYFAFRAAIWGGFTGIVKLLLSGEDKFGHMRLPSIAAAANQVEIFKLLCEHLHVPLDEPHNIGEAASYGHIDFVKLCLANGVDVNRSYSRIPDAWEIESPLYYASSRGYRDIVQLLLSYGANATDYINRWSSLSGAASHGHCEIMQDLLAAGSVPVHDHRWSPLNSAVRNGQVRAVEVLLDSGLELWYKDYALVMAAEGGHETIVRLLARRGANLNGYIKNQTLTSPMLEAMIHGHPHIVRILLELGAKPVGPFPISDQSGVLEKGKYPRIDESRVKPAIIPSAWNGKSCEGQF